jgi:hypothetical protein
MASTNPDSLKLLLKTQTHPDAVKNVRSTLERAGFCRTILNLILATLILIPLILIFILMFVLIVPFVLPFYFTCPERTRHVLGIVEKSTRESPEWMLPQKPSPDLPTKLRGILYMRGNPFFDDLVTMERSPWDSETRSCWLPFYQAYTWSVREGFVALVLMVGARLIGYRYKFTFNEELSEADIGLYMFCFRFPSCIVKFAMTDVSKLQDGSLWERWSVVLGQPLLSYWAERVVDGDRAKTSFWHHTLDEVPPCCWTKSRTSLLGCGPPYATRASFKDSLDTSDEDLSSGGSLEEEQGEV